ncbi:hypothetical protein B0O99DRAFT_612410 [Bisporella sp. PMI_857]|nr:hypothetical protein B0O99DRAFT_612410 [Bisporella sp. PMI_857]
MAGIPRGKHRAATETEDEESDEKDIGVVLDSMHIDSPDTLEVSQQPMAAPTTVQGGEVGSTSRGSSRFKPRKEAFNRRRPTKATAPKGKSLSAQYNTSSPDANSSPTTYPPIPNTEEANSKHEDTPAITSHSAACAESALHVTPSPTPRNISSPSLVSTSKIATTSPFPVPVPVTSAPLTCSDTHQTPPASSAVGPSSPATRLPSTTDSVNVLSNRLSHTELDESSTIVNNQLVHEFTQLCSLGKRDAPDDVCDPARPDAKRRRL